MAADPEGDLADAHPFVLLADDEQDAPLDEGQVGSSRGDRSIGDRDRTSHDPLKVPDSPAFHDWIVVPDTFHVEQIGARARRRASHVCRLGLS